MWEFSMSFHINIMAFGLIMDLLEQTQQTPWGPCMFQVHLQANCSPSQSCILSLINVDTHFLSSFPSGPFKEETVTSVFKASIW